MVHTQTRQIHHHYISVRIAKCRKHILIHHKHPKIHIINNKIEYIIISGRLWCTPKRAKYIIIGVCIAAGLITFPEFFEYSMSCVPNKQSCHPERSEFAMTAAYSYGYVWTNQVI